MILLSVLIDETLFIVSDKLHQHFESSLPLVFVFRCVFFKYTASNNVSRATYSDSRSSFGKGSFPLHDSSNLRTCWAIVFQKNASVCTLSLSLSVRERCVFNIKERKSNKHFYWYDNFSVSGSSRTTLISSSKRPDRIGTTVVANVGFCEGRKLEFLRGKTVNRGREALRNSSR